MLTLFATLYIINSCLACFRFSHISVVIAVLTFFSFNSPISSNSVVPVPLIFNVHNISLSHFPCWPFIVPVLASVDLTNCVWLWGHWVFEWRRCGKESHDSSVGDSTNVFGLPLQPVCILSHFRQFLDFVFISCLILTELDTHYLLVILNVIFENVLQKLIGCWWINKDNGRYFWKYTLNKTFCYECRLRRKWNMLF